MQKTVLFQVHIYDILNTVNRYVDWLTGVALYLNYTTFFPHYKADNVKFNNRNCLLIGYNNKICLHFTTMDFLLNNRVAD